MIGDSEEPMTGPLLLCLVLHQIVCAISTDNLGPPPGLHINLSKCELVSITSICSRVSWKGENVDELLFDFKEVLAQRQVRAVCSVDHGENKQSGVLDASACIASGSKTVFDVLKEKHPDPSQSSVHSFLQCNKSKAVLTLVALILGIEGYYLQRDLATQVLSSAATIQSRLAAIAVSLRNAYLIAANTSKLVSAVTMETDQTNATLRSVGVVLDRTAVTIANLTLTLADLKAKFAQNANRLDQVNNATLSTQQLSRQLLTKALPTVQADADLVKDEANRVLVQSESDLLTSRNLRKRADGLATLTQNQLLILESYQLTKERLQQRQLDIQDDTRRLANQIGVLSDQLHKLVAKNTACLDKDQLV
eukprot:Em0001g1974a